MDGLTLKRGFKVCVAYDILKIPIVKDILNIIKIRKPLISLIGTERRNEFYERCKERIERKDAVCLFELFSKYGISSKNIHTAKLIFNSTPNDMELEFMYSLLSNEILKIVVDIWKEYNDTYAIMSTICSSKNNYNVNDMYTFKNILRNSIFKTVYEILLSVYFNNTSSIYLTPDKKFIKFMNVVKNMELTDIVDIDVTDVIGSLERMKITKIPNNNDQIRILNSEFKIPKAYFGAAELIVLDETKAMPDMTRPVPGFRETANVIHSPVTNVNNYEKEDMFSVIYKTIDRLPTNDEEGYSELFQASTADVNKLLLMQTLDTLKQVNNNRNNSVKNITVNINKPVEVMKVDDIPFDLRR